MRRAVYSASSHYASARKNTIAGFRILTGAHRRFDRVGEYEKAFADFEGTRFAVATSMARIALYHVLRSQGLAPGDRVLLSPVNIPEMLAVILALGLEPVFVDFAPRSLFPDPEDLRRKLERGAKVFFLTCVAGQIGDLEAIRSVCERGGITLVIDGTQALGSTFQGKSLSAWADLAIFSTCEFKFVHTYRGGVICSDSEKHYESVKAAVSRTSECQRTGYLLRKWAEDTLISAVLNPFLLRNVSFHLKDRIFTQDPLRDRMAVDSQPLLFSTLGTDFHRMKGGVPDYMLFRASNFEAAHGTEALKKARKAIDHHRMIAKRYLAAFREFDLIPLTSQKLESSYWRFPLLFPERSLAMRFKSAMWKTGIIVEKTGLSLLSRDVGQAGELIDSTVYLPCHLGVDAAAADRIVIMARETLSDLGMKGGS